MDNNDVYNILRALSKKFSMTNSVYRIWNSLFYVPNYPNDVIQRIMVDNNVYWDSQGLAVVDRYLPENAVICDIGANIGSQAIFWAVERGAKKVYAFEPLPEVCGIMRENVRLNNLEGVIETFNFGLSDVESNASIASYTQGNIGATSFKLSPMGPFQMKKLDSVWIQEKVDLIKINVQGAEVEVLKGGERLIKEHRPIIVLTSFERRLECEEILLNLDYQLVETIRTDEKFVYIPHKSLF